MSQISELSKGLIAHFPLSEAHPTTELISNIIGTPTDVFHCLDRQGSGRRWLENTNTSYTSFADDARYDFGTGDFTLIVSFTPANITDNGKYIISKEAGGIGYGLYQEDNDIWIRLDDGTTDVSAIIGTDILVVGTKITCEVVFNRAGNAVLYLNGSTSSSGTVAISTASLTLDNTGAFVVGNIEAHNQGFTGQIHFVRAFNFALTTQIANYSKSEYPIEAVDRGATGTSLVTGDNSTFASDTGWWTKEAGITIADGVCHFNTALNGHSLYKYPFSTIGKYYRFTYSVVSYTSGGIKVIRGATKTGTVTNNSEVILDTDGYGAQWMSVNSAVLDIDNVSVVQLGCVLDLNASGLGMSSYTARDATKWTDFTNNLTATVSGATLVIPPASNLGATAFNGTTSVINMGDNDSFTPPSIFSISFWVYPFKISDDWVGAIGKYTSGSNIEYEAYIRSTGAIIFYIYSDASNGFQTTTTNNLSSINQWHHVVLGWNGSVFVIYVNGVATAHTATIIGSGFTSFTNTSASLRIGAARPNIFGNVLMSNVKFYSGAPTQDFIKILYDLGR